MLTSDAGGCINFAQRESHLYAVCLCRYSGWAHFNGSDKSQQNTVTGVKCVSIRRRDYKSGWRRQQLFSRKLELHAIRRR